MKRILSILILLILLSTGALSEETNPKEVTSAVIELKISGKVHIGEGIDKITYMQTFPLEDENQKILFVNSTPEYTIITDENGNRQIVFTWLLPGADAMEHKNALNYKINMQLERKSFPIISISQDTGEYLKNDNDITRWDAGIKNKASEIATYDNDLLNSGKFSSWIYKNIEYDLNFSSSEEVARWVFENKKGVCDEFSHLLIAMVRSQDIPARDVAGVVYDGEEWSTHAWTEIYYNGKWIPFDSTYNEMGFVDSTHVVYSLDANNAEISENIEWEGHIIEGFVDEEKIQEGIYNEKEETIKLLKINKTKILDADLAFDDPEVSENTVVNATLELKNLINLPIIGTFDVITPDEINYLDNVEIFYLEPYAKTNLTLNFKVPKMKDINLKYYLPVLVRTFPYATAESELSAIPKMIAGISISINPSIITGPGVVGKDIKIDANMINRNPTKREITINACVHSKMVNNCKRKFVTLEGNSDKVEEVLFKVPYGNYTLSVEAIAGESLDEFTKNVYIGGTVSDEFVDAPYIGKLRIENFFIIVFLVIMVIGMVLVLRRHY